MAPISLHDSCHTRKKVWSRTASSHSPTKQTIGVRISPKAVSGNGRCGNEWTAEVQSTQIMLCPHERLRTSGPFAIHSSLFSPIGSLGTSFLHGRRELRAFSSFWPLLSVPLSVFLSHAFGYVVFWTLSLPRWVEALSTSWCGLIVLYKYVWVIGFRTRVGRTMWSSPLRGRGFRID